MTDAVITEGGLLALGAGVGDAIITQGGHLPFATIRPDCLITQGGQLTFTTVLIDMILTQGGLLALSRYSYCATKHCQCWIIRCRDGDVYRFTSLDVDFPWVGGTFKACGGLDPSASEQGANLGDVGDMELTGVVTIDEVTEEDLYGGKFDDAFVEVWEVPYEDAGGETPRRLAAGWMGDLSHGDATFKAQVLGPGQRITQQAIVTVVAPKCRWDFGSAQCGVDTEALKTTGDVIIATNRESFMANLGLMSDGGIQWENGKVRWTGGRNDGYVTETKTVDFVTGIVVLWALPPYLPQAGDTFDLLPGCLQDGATCQNVYNNKINFGGFEDVPGDKALNETPNASA